MPTKISLNKKVVVVTGAGRGIGQTIAIACAQSGANIVIASRSLEELKKTELEISKKTNAKVLSVVCDISNEMQVKQLFQQIKEITHEGSQNNFGKFFALVCAAGIYGTIGPFEEVSFSKWKQAIEINLFGTAFCIQQALPFFKKQQSGRIILLAGGGQNAMPNFTSYVTSKGGIFRLTETLGAELLASHIYINAIAPGAVNTKFLDELIAAGPEKAGATTYQKALEQKEKGGVPPQKAADLALYLLSDASKGLTGKILSALWDPYQKFENLEKITQSDLYTMKRVTDDKGGTRGK